MNLLAPASVPQWLDPRPSDPAVAGSIPGWVGYMLGHPITVVLNVFWHWKATGLKVSKVMGIQNQEEHIGHIKQLKVTDIRIVIFFLKHSICAPIFSPKVKT